MTTWFVGIYRKLFGWSRCRRCKKPLRSRASRRRGFGPGCEKMHWLESEVDKRQLFGSAEKMQPLNEVKCACARDEEEARAEFQAKLARHAAEPMPAGSVQ